MRYAPSLTNISPTTDLPLAIPPVSPSLIMVVLTNDGTNLTWRGKSKVRSQIEEVKTAGLLLQCDFLLLTSSQLRRLHGIRHQHGNGQRPYASRHRRNRPSSFRHLRMYISDKRRALREKSFPPFCVGHKRSWK